jgi:hypothetical protein
VGIDFDLMEELTCRQKWEAYLKEETEEATTMMGPYTDIIENEGYSVLLKKPDGGMEPSSSFIGRDAQGKAWSIQVFDAVGDDEDGLSQDEVFQDWRRTTRVCPFTTPLHDAFVKDGALHLVYQLDGGSLSMAGALQQSVSSGGFITGNKEGDEDIIEQWVAQLLWTIR